MVLYPILEEMYMNFLINNSFNIELVAADQSFGFLDQNLSFLISIYGATQLVYENIKTEN